MWILSKTSISTSKGAQGLLSRILEISSTSTRRTQTGSFHNVSCTVLSSMCFLLMPFLSGAPNQDRLLRAHNRYITKEEYRRHLDHVRDVARSQGVDYTLEKNNADVIIGPADSRLTGVAAGAGA